MSMSDIWKSGCELNNEKMRDICLYIFIYVYIGKERERGGKERKRKRGGEGKTVYPDLSYLISYR